MSSEALLDGRHDSAHLAGAGPIPAGLARELIADSLDTGAGATLRRLYATPETGALVALDSRARIFPAGLAQFLRLRDQFCRTPWCNAPIRHLDHPQPARDGGPTTAQNAQGLCEACNYAKEAPGWTTHTTGTGTGTGTGVETTTPTGHRHRTRPPLPPGPTRPPRTTRPPQRSRAEISFRHDLHLVLAC
jgi:hypothetical protein